VLIIVYIEQFNDNIVYLALFIDDGLIISNSQQSIDIVINSLKNMFSLKVGNVGTFIGMQIERDRSNKSIFMHQTVYTLRIIERFKMMDANPVSVSADSHTILTDND